VVYISVVARALLGSVFLVSAASKGATPNRFHAFSSWIAALPLPAKSPSTPIAAGVIAFEAIIAAMLAIPGTVRLGFGLAVVLLSVFIGSTVVILRKDTRTTCMCFGRSTAAMGYRHVVRDLILLIAAILGLMSAAEPLPAPAGLGLAVLGAVAMAVLVITWDDIVFLVAGLEAESV